MVEVVQDWRPSYLMSTLGSFGEGSTSMAVSGHERARASGRSGHGEGSSGWGAGSGKWGVPSEWRGV